MASIDAVIASFTVSLALVDKGKALEKIGGGHVKKSNVVFLSGKPLTRRPVDSTIFKSQFLRTWMVYRLFRVQERAENLFFFFSFDSIHDRNKVLRGGVWCFDRAPVALELFDGI
ncbi:hypothetical protein ACLB2K_029678 [Fragaria x ananassa]